MADIAAMFSWSLADMSDLSLTELVEWRERACQIHENMHKHGQQR